jgi:two-component system sensor histidine kinase CpxA
MSRLAVKIFAWIWLAFVLLLAGLSFVVDRWNQDVEPQPMGVPQLRQWQQIQERIGFVFQRRGMEGLKQFARDTRENRGMELYVLNDAGNDQIGQEVPQVIRQYLVAHRSRGPMMQLLEQRLILGPGPVPFLQLQGSPVGHLVLWLPITDIGSAPVSSLWSGPQAKLRLAVAIVASGIVALLLSLSLTRPLRRLQSAVSQLGKGNYEIANLDLAAQRRDEIGDLAREFQSMATSLKVSSAARQRLMRDISHELRSPLARLQAAIELAELQFGQADKSGFERMELECGRLNDMIGGVLALARAEHRDTELVPQTFDLIEVIQDLVEDARFEGSAQDKQVELISLDQAPCLGNMTIISSAIENVLRNALRYTPPGSSVQIELRKRTVFFEISIRDRGLGVPPAELEKIFEPFYRVIDSSEHLTTGTGVGLAIASRGVQQHGGKIQASNRPDGGLEILITLPTTIVKRDAKDIYFGRLL